MKVTFKSMFKKINLKAFFSVNPLKLKKSLKFIFKRVFIKKVFFKNNLDNYNIPLYLCSSFLIQF